MFKRKIMRRSFMFKFISVYEKLLAKMSDKFYLSNMELRFSLFSIYSIKNIFFVAFVSLVTLIFPMSLFFFVIPITAVAMPILELINSLRVLRVLMKLHTLVFYSSKALYWVFVIFCHGLTLIYLFASRYNFYHVIILKEHFTIQSTLLLAFVLFVGFFGSYLRILISFSNIIIGVTRCYGNPRALLLAAPGPTISLLLDLHERLFSSVPTSHLRADTLSRISYYQKDMTIGSAGLFAIPKKVTFLSRPIHLSFFKRFTGKTPGHVHSILNTLNKNTPKVAPIFMQSHTNPTGTKTSSIKSPNDSIGTNPNSNAKKPLTPSTVSNNFGISAKPLTFDSITGKIHLPKNTVESSSTPAQEEKLSTFLSQLIDAKKKLKSFSGKEFDTQITSNTKVEDISDTSLLAELKKRELVKEAGKEVTGKFLDANNNPITIGTPKNGVKLTALGQAYVKKYDIEAAVPQTTAASSESIISNTDNIEFKVIFPPKPSEKTFIESGEQKHLLVVFNQPNNTYYGIGYFTSKLSGENISDIQYSAFEKLKETNINVDLIKSQQFMKFNSLQDIKENNVNPVKYSKEYLGLISDKVFIFKDAVKVLNLKPCKNFNPDGITKEDALAICKAFDTVAEKNNKHPSTEDQLKQQDLNKLKQKESNESMKKQKEGLKKQQEVNNLNTNINDKNNL